MSLIYSPFPSQFSNLVKSFNYEELHNQYKEELLNDTGHIYAGWKFEKIREANEKKNIEWDHQLNEYSDQLFDKYILEITKKNNFQDESFVSDLEKDHEKLLTEALLKLEIKYTTLKEFKQTELNIFKRLLEQRITVEYNKISIEKIREYRSKYKICKYD